MKKILAALITCSSLLAVSAFAQPPAIMVIEEDDNAYVEFKKEVGPSGFTLITEVTSPNPEIMEFVPGSITCIQGSACFFNVRLKKDGPINFAPFDTSFIPYGYASVDPVTNDASINFDLWGFNNFHIADIATIPALTPEAATTFSPFGAAEGSKAGETDEYIEIRVKIFTIENADPAIAEYQRYQIIASGITFPTGELTLWNDGEFFGPNYGSADGNKGQVNFLPLSDLLAFWVNNWLISPGHYAAVRLYTNGSSELDEGLDLTGFTESEITMNCEFGTVIEVFVGGPADSSQTFVGEVTCDGLANTYTFNIPTNVNLTDIQTGMWLHVPTWKNSTINVNTWGINIFEAKLTK